MKNFNSGIYLITNKINNKHYVGSTHNFTSRWKGHKSMLNRNVHFNSHLQASWNKYGESAFEFSILEEIDSSLEDLDEKLIIQEEYYILKYDCIKNGYNTRLKCNTNSGLKWSEESKKKFSEYRKNHIVKEAVNALNECAKTQIGKSNLAASDWYNSLSEEEKQKHNTICAQRRIEEAKKRGYWHTQESINKTILTKKQKGLIKPISLYNLDGTLYKTYESYSDCLREFEENTKNSSCLGQCIKSGKLFHNYIVSKDLSKFISNYNKIVKLVNSNKRNLKYYKYSPKFELLDIFTSKNDASIDVGLTKSGGKFNECLISGDLYKGYYWRIVEPISSDVYSKSGEFSETPEVDNTEPSNSLTTVEGATTNN